MKYEEEQIIIVGRSIGSGPASYLGANYNPGALVLISGFTSLQGIAKDLAGEWLKHLIKERFKNEENMTKVECPTLIIHGLKDKLINYQHSVRLHGNICYLLINL
jgi:abhydrolase domain-containing protein 17